MLHSVLQLLIDIYYNTIYIWILDGETRSLISLDNETDVERVPSGIGWCFPDPCDFFSYIYSSTLDSLSIGTFLKVKDQELFI